VDDPEVVMEAAATFLAVRPRSVDETRRRLRDHGYRPGLVESVVDRLIELGYLDDEAFARAWVESRDRSRPRGEGALRRELLLKGVVRDVIDDVLALRVEGGGGDNAAARRLVDSRRTSLEREPDERMRRAAAYALLARSGFDPETCREVSAGVVSVEAEGASGAAQRRRRSPS